MLMWYSTKEFYEFEEDQICAVLNNLLVEGSFRYVSVYPNKDILFTHDNIDKIEKLLLKDKPKGFIINKFNEEDETFIIKNDIQNTFISIVGLIPNHKEVLEKFNTLPKNAVPGPDFFLKEAKGSWCLFNLELCGYSIHNRGGLGVWEIHKSDCSVLYSTVPLNSSSRYISSSEIQCFNYNDTRGSSLNYNDTWGSSLFINEKDLEENQDTKHVFLCSGGLDSICTVLDTLYNFIRPPKQPIDLVYIKWGTKAQEQEIQVVKEFGKILNERGFITDVIILECTSLFEEYLKVAGYQLSEVKLLSKNSESGKKEAQNGSAYVPLRNTFMINILAARYEKTHLNTRVNFYLGLNTDDGFAVNMLDNTVAWLWNINNSIKLNGSGTYKFQVLAPFVNNTKMEMVQKITKDSILNRALIKKTFSCYYPKDGKACNECGSCYIRKKVFSKDQI